MYVQPSRHEGFCITLAEALCFSNPIIATNFTGAQEQLQNRQNCVVVGMSAEDVSNGVVTALRMMRPTNIIQKQYYDELSKLLELIK